MELSRTNDDLNRICAKQMRNRWQMNNTFVGNSVNISHWKRERNHIEHVKNKNMHQSNMFNKVPPPKPASLTRHSQSHSPSLTHHSHKHVPISLLPFHLSHSLVAHSRATSRRKRTTAPEPHVTSHKNLTRIHHCRPPNTSPVEIATPPQPPF